MGVACLILGASGSGKSTSLRNFKEGEVGIFNVASKPLPFRSNLKTADGADYDTIMKRLEDNGLNDDDPIRTFVIDDSQYLMVFDDFRRAKDTGYTKWSEMALSFYNLVQCAIMRTNPNTIVYFLHHVDIDEDGRTKAKTVGKLLDAKLVLEGLFSVVLLAGTDGTDYWFETQNDGHTTVKSPMGMFEDKRIPNDLAAVDAAIREYWRLEK